MKTEINRGIVKVISIVPFIPWANSPTADNRYGQVISNTLLSVHHGVKRPQIMGRRDPLATLSLNRIVRKKWGILSQYDIQKDYQTRVIFRIFEWHGYCWGILCVERVRDENRKGQEKSIEKGNDTLKKT